MILILVLSLAMTAGTTPNNSQNIPVEKLSTPNLQFVCFNVPQSAGKPADWVSLIFDYEHPNKIVGFQVYKEKNLEQIVLKNAVYKIEISEFEGRQVIHILARGVSARKQIDFDITFRATLAETRADYKIANGNLTYNAVDCVRHPPGKKWRMEEIK